MAANPIVNLITQGARARGLDPAAVLAVASQEGLSGRPGDQGSSFGPFQLHIGGAFPTGQVPRGQEQAWAMSPAGINYALDRIAGVAKGLRGPQAVSAIVSRFERPANPGREIAGANAAYGNYGALPAAAPTLPSLTAPAGTPAVPTPRGLSSALAQAVNTGNQMFGLPPLPAQLLSPVAPAAAPTLAPPAARTLPIPPGPGGGQGAAPPLAGPRRLTAIPAGISTRPGIELNAQVLPAVSQIVGRFGVRVNSGYRSPEHNAAVGGAAHSDHLSGNAVDFVGTPGQMRALYNWAQGRFPYVEPWGQAGGNHVHISFQRGG